MRFTMYVCILDGAILEFQGFGKGIHSIYPHDHDLSHFLVKNLNYFEEKKVTGRFGDCSIFWN